ncbi:MAG: hypothetical protein WC693_04535 [Patescibacteria group bacterium]|jgi:hypothetical protein
MDIFQEIKKTLAERSGEWKEKKGIWEFSTVIAERKAFLAKKKLTYSAKMKIDEENKSVSFSEILIDSGSGFSSGGGFDDGISTGVGFKKETYNTMNKGREGTIEEQSDLFGKKYEYQFDYKEIRSKVENVVKSVGYNFEYQILPVK